MTGESEHTFSIAQRALELMKTHSSSAHPRSYEVWYTYVAGHKPQMNETIKRLTAERGSLSDADIDALYEAHLAPNQLSAEAEKTTAGVLVEIDQVMDMIDTALGSTAKYGASLQALSHDLAGPVDRGRIREVLQSLVAATHDVTATNRSLEARLKETRGEIETLRETLDAARVEALTDPLTGLSNRKHFEDMLTKAVDHASAHSALLALIVVDIDHFKHFNDTYGHLTGDQVLRLVGMTMRESVKIIQATLARFGGEEFGVILPDTSLEAARATAEQIRQSVASRDLVKRSTGELLGKVTASLGVASFRQGDTSISLLERADQCMFAAKRMGRNRTLADTDTADVVLSNVA